MQLSYCDNCGVKLDGENRAGKSFTCTATRDRDIPILPSTPIIIGVELSYWSNAGMTRTVKGNGDFCVDCVENVIIDAIVARRDALQLANQEEEDQDGEEDSEDTTGDDDGDDGADSDDADDDGISGREEDSAEVEDLDEEDLDEEEDGEETQPVLEG